jgi:hypothetical protein
MCICGTKKKFRRPIVSGAFGLLAILFEVSICFSQTPEKLKIKFLDYYFENGSPVNWTIDGDTILKISLLPDYERESLNRQTTHWHFRIEADQGTHIRMSISKMVNEVYNGSPAKEWWDKNHPISCYISYDRKIWIPVPTKFYGERELLVDFIMEKKDVWIARLPAYSISELDNLESAFSGNSWFKVIPVGSTLEGRPLEIIQLGDPDAPGSVIIRARAHPWEPGGSWVVEGLIRGFLQENSQKWLKTYCVYIMPMANKDGVARGMTRFNIAGMDLNRKWDKMSDPELCPEKYALESFIEGLSRKGISPDLGIDIHNDDAGSISFTTHKKNDTLFLKNTRIFEKLMRANTCFTEKVNYSWKEPGSEDKFVMFEDGLYSRYGIEALVWELNANWINTTQGMPTQADWIKTGENLNRVFYEYFQSMK